MEIDRKEKLGTGKSTHPNCMCATDSNRQERLENASKFKECTKCYGNGKHTTEWSTIGPL